jgi:DNA-binding protein H-NS
MAPLVEDGWRAVAVDQAHPLDAAFLYAYRVQHADRREGRRALEKELSNFVKDLIFGAKTRRRVADSNAARKSSKRASKRATVKYRDGDNTWAGRGKRPAWLNERLASGAKLEDFLVR